MYNKIRFDTFMLICFFMITILGLSACDSDEKITQEPPSQTYVLQEISYSLPEQQ